MTMRTATYDDVRKKMRPGDVIAFGGKGHFSEVIKWVTRAPVSHLGVVLQTRLAFADNEDDFYNQVIESSGDGVGIINLSIRMSYDGEIWWLPLSKPTREKFKEKPFFDFLVRQEHKKYDMPQAISSALDALDNITNSTRNREDFSKFFCSELVAAGLEKAGVCGTINASEVTPVDLCMFNLFDDDYYLLKGDQREISGYNSINPDGWGM